MIPIHHAIYLYMSMRYMFIIIALMDTYMCVCIVREWSGHPSMHTYIRWVWRGILMHPTYIRTTVCTSWLFICHSILRSILSNIRKSAFRTRVNEVSGKGRQGLIHTCMGDSSTSFLACPGLGISRNWGGDHNFSLRGLALNRWWGIFEPCWGRGRNVEIITGFKVVDHIMSVSPQIGHGSRQTSVARASRYILWGKRRHGRVHLSAFLGYRKLIQNRVCCLYVCVCVWCVHA